MKKFFLSLLVITFLLIGASTVNAITVKLTDTNPPPEPLTNPLGNDINSPQDLIGQILDSVLGVIGSLALLMFVYGGITWMTSAGNQEKVKKGRDIIVWSAIGLVIIFSAYGLTRVLIEGLVR